MARKINIRVRSTAHTTSNGNIRVQTSVSNGHTTKTTTKTIRAR